MNYELITLESQTCVECLPGGGLLQKESDMLDLIAACGEAGADRLLVHAENLTPDFYQLKTRLAGDLLQKLVNYRVRCAFLLDRELVGNGHFYEMMIETNRGRQFHFGFEREEAYRWLLTLASQVSGLPREG